MAGKIRLVLARPDKTVADENVFGVVLPAYNDNLTIIADRAPGIVELKPGVVQLLEEEDRPGKKYFISGGVADVAGDVCTVSAEKAFAAAEITLAEADRRLRETSGNFASFYRVVCEYLTAFPEK